LGSFIDECDRIFAYVEYITPREKKFEYDRSSNLPALISELKKKNITTMRELRYFMYNLVTNQPPYPDLGDFADFHELLITNKGPHL
jgi:hypothetical protein